MPVKPLDIHGFLKHAKDLGFQGVQLCENLGIARMDEESLRTVNRDAVALGLSVEVGMNGADRENLYHHLKIAENLSANLVRVVLGGKSCKRKEEAEQAQLYYLGILREVLPAFRDSGITIGIENHFDLPTRALREMVEAVNDPAVTLILDTTNCIHFMERPEEALELCRGRIGEVHLKDYKAQKIEAGHLFSGTVLGEGELDVRRFLECCDRIVLEMTIRRSRQQSAKEVISWEEDSVKRSAKNLVSLLEGGSE